MTRASERIRRTQVGSVHVEVKDGMLRGVLRRPRNCEFLPSQGDAVLIAEPVFGRVDRALDDSDIVALQALRDRRVRAHFRVVTIGRVGTPRMVYTLIGVETPDGVIGRTTSEPAPGADAAASDEVTDIDPPKE